MRHLPKHLRPRWRYLAVRVETRPTVRLERGAFQRRLWYAAGNLLGDPGSADADCTVVRFHGEQGTSEAIVRARRGETGPARAALACVDRVDTRPVGVRVLGISGTIRACEERYLGDTGGQTDEKAVVFDGTDAIARVRGERVDVDGVGATTTDVRLRDAGRETEN